jgi:hypothetical protein
MPCYYTGSKEGDAALAYEESVKSLTKKITKLTRLLCKTCEHIEHLEVTFPSEEIENWWEKHKKTDAKRKGKK